MKALVMLSALLLLVACHVRYPQYKIYKEAGRADTRAEFRKKYRFCEDHGNRLYRSFVKVYYGRVGINEIIGGHAYPKEIWGGCGGKRGLGIVLKCRKCQRQYDEERK